MPFSRAFVAVALSAGVVVAGSGFLFGLRGAWKESNAVRAATPPPAAVVDVAAVVTRDITEWQNYSGRLEAVDRVEVRALVPGTIMAVYFKDGQLVKKGDPLFLIDPRPYQAVIDQVTAQLAAARSKAGLAAADYSRAKNLINGSWIAKRDYDARADTSNEADESVKAAEAALESALVNLAYTRIDAPISGRMSRAEMTVGNVVAAGVGSPALTTLVSVSPIYAAFDVDEQTYLRYLSHDAGEVVPVKLGLANETGYSRHGKVAFVDNQLDSASGTIRVRATFENPDAALVPGLYARLAIGGSPQHPAVLIDDRAVSTDQAKKFVVIVDPRNKALYREIKLGEISDGLRVITSGLSSGDRIVVSGLQRVKIGDEVTPNTVEMSGENLPEKKS
jgi:membrane fusion protein, multidrug efflux system